MSAPKGNLSLHFDACSEEIVPCLYGDVHVLRDSIGLEWLRERIAEVPDEDYIALDFEAWCVHPLQDNAFRYFQDAQIMLTALSYEPHWRAVIVHIGNTVPEREWLELATSRTIAVYNASYDVRLIMRVLGRPPARYIDSLVLAGLISSGRTPEQMNTSGDDDQATGHSLTDMMALFFNQPLSKQLVKAFYSRSGVVVDDRLIRYAAEDASSTWWLTSALLDRIRQDGVEHIAQLEHDVSSFLLHMSQCGVRVDERAVRGYAHEIERRAEQQFESILHRMTEDRWTAVGPEQPGVLCEPVDIEQLIPPYCRRYLGTKAKGATLGAMQLAARYYNNRTIAEPQLRAGELARLALEEPNRRVVVYKIPNDPEQTLTVSARDAIRLDSPSWATAYLRYLSGGMIAGTRAQQVQTFYNAVQQGMLHPMDESPAIQLASQLCIDLLSYRALRKLLSSFIEPWLNQHMTREGDTTRIHTSFLQTKARSGRIVSQNPNMQNIARPKVLGIDGETDVEVDLRGAIIADEGCVLVTADYSQYELRVAAERAGEERMIEMFQHAHNLHRQLESLLASHGIRPWHKERIAAISSRDTHIAEVLKQIKESDLHRWVASLVFHKPQSEISSTERTMAKAVSFGVLYGMGAVSLAQRLQASGLKCSIEEAQQILQNYFRSFPTLAQYIQDVKLRMLQDGYTATILGRKRWVVLPDPLLEPPDIPPLGLLNNMFRNRVAAIEREMFNHTIQGVNADAIKLAIVYLYRQLIHDSMWDTGREHPVLTIHDELVVQAMEGRADRMAELVLDCMTRASVDAGLKRVPTQVEVTVSHRWSK